MMVKDLISFGEIIQSLHEIWNFKSLVTRKQYLILVMTSNFNYTNDNIFSSESIIMWTPLGTCPVFFPTNSGSDVILLLSIYIYSFFHDPAICSQLEPLLLLHFLDIWAIPLKDILGKLAIYEG